MDKRGEIYEFLQRRGRPCQLPGVWSGLPCHAAFIQPADEPEALLVELTSSFEILELVGAGVVQVDEFGSASVNPSLVQKGSFVLPLREAGGKQPFDLLAGCAGTIRSAWPLFTALDDHRLQDLFMGLYGHLLAVCSLEEMALFWSLGLPAVPAAGLDRISGQHVGAFCQALCLPRRGDQSRSDGDPQSLVLVDWRPLQLQMDIDARIEPAEKHLARLHSHLGIPLDDFRVWRPTETEIELLQFRAQHGDRHDLQDAIIRSLKESSRPLIERLDPRTSGPQSYGAAVRDWISVQHGFVDSSHQQQAWNRIQELQEAQVIQPLMARAQEISDPLQQSRLLALADVNRLIHNQVLLMSAKFTRSAQFDGPLNHGKDEFQQVMALADRVVALTEGRRVCRPTQLSRRVERPQRGANCPTSPGST